MTGKEADLVGEVGAYTICCLPGDLHAHVDVSIPSDSERGKVLEGKEFFDVHE